MSVIAETFAQTAGADAIEGGSTGVDTLTLLAASTDIDGTAAGDATNGNVVNMGSTAIDEATVTSTLGNHLGNGATQIAPNTATFTFANGTATTTTATNASQVQSIGGIENITGSDGEDYIVGSAANNAINGNAGDDYIHGGDGDDTITVDNQTEYANDVYNGGLGSDTVSIGATVVFSTTDANLQGIENITIGTGALDVTLLGQSEGFNITGSAGANEIKGGQGNDTITLVTGTNADVIHFGLFSANGTDTITVFDTTEDHLNFDATMTGVTNVVATTDIAASAGDADFIDNEVYVYADGATASAGGKGTATITDYTNLTQVAAFLDDAMKDNTAGTGSTSNDTTAGDEAIFVVNDLVGNKAYGYHFKENGTATDASAGGVIVAAELTLLAVVSEEGGGAIVAADITLREWLR